MKDELVTVLEAVRRAQAELAAYLDSADRNAELTIAKLVGILERREVVGAVRLLQPWAARIPSSTVAQAPERQPHLPHEGAGHSALRVVAGSTRSARRAGSTQAASATPAMTTAMEAKVAGSHGLT